MKIIAMTETPPVNETQLTEEERIEARLQEIRDWRTLMWVGMLAWIPLGVTSALLLGIHPLIYIGTCYFVILEIGHMRLMLLRCPKCGERFHSLFWKLWMWKCQNCGLPLHKG